MPQRPPLLGAALAAGAFAAGLGVAFEADLAGGNVQRGLPAWPAHGVECVRALAQQTAQLWAVVVDDRPKDRVQRGGNGKPHSLSTLAKYCGKASTFSNPQNRARPLQPAQINGAFVHTCCARARTYGLLRHREFTFSRGTALLIVTSKERQRVRCRFSLQRPLRRERGRCGRGIMYHGRRGRGGAAGRTGAGGGARPRSRYNV
eukprot:gene12293-biopygen1905